MTTTERSLVIINQSNRSTNSIAYVYKLDPLELPKRELTSDILEVRGFEPLASCLQSTRSPN